MATQFLQLVNGRRQRRLPGDPHQHARILLVENAIGALGTGVAGALRRVMPGDGLGNHRRLAVGQRVITPHDSLQFGEFTDHFRRQIGLGQPRRPRRQPGVGTHQGRHMGGDGGQTLHFVGHAAQTGVVQPFGQFGQAGLQAMLAVGVPEEFGVRQTGPQHPFITGDDGLAAVGGLHVGDHQEAVGQPAVVLQQRKIFLMRAHRGDQHLVRHRHELLVDAAHQHHRPFHQSGHLGQQAVVGTQRQPLGRRRRLGLGENDLSPFAGVQNHPGGFQLCRVIGGIADGEGAGAEESMALRQVSRRHAGEAHRHHRPVQQAENALQRPHPAFRPAAPALGLGPGKGGQGLFHHILHHQRGGPAGAADDGEIKDPLAAVPLFAVGQSDAGPLEKAVDGGLRRTDPGAAPLLGDIRRGRRQTVDDQGQAARRDERPHLPPGQAGGRQAIAHQALQILGGAGLHAGGNFLGKQFQQQLGHGRHTPAASQPSQQALARLRTRPI